MLTLETELHSVLSIAKALREGATVYTNLKEHPEFKLKVADVRAVHGSADVEVLTVFGRRVASRVWIETAAGDEPATEAAAG